VSLRTDQRTGRQEPNVIGPELLELQGPQLNFPYAIEDFDVEALFNFALSSDSVLR
jgi:hypothetical protein